MTPERFHASLRAVFSATSGRIKYRLGAKADFTEEERSSPELVLRKLRSLTHLDCSGWVQAVMVHAGLKYFPLGSYHQRTWVEQSWYRLADPEAYKRYALSDAGRMFICFRTQRRGAGGSIRYGHVWLASAGRIYHCRSKLGVVSEPWHVLVSEHTFEVGRPIDETGR